LGAINDFDELRWIVVNRDSRRLIAAGKTALQPKIVNN